MFIVTLRFAANRDKAGALMDEHNAWLRRGFEEGILLLAGSLQPRAGGVILANGVSRQALNAFVQSDPFVAQNVVAAEVLEVVPGRTDPRLAFLAA